MSEKAEYEIPESKKFELPASKNEILNYIADATEGCTKESAHKIEVNIVNKDGTTTGNMTRMVELVLDGQSMCRGISVEGLDIDQCISAEAVRRVRKLRGQKKVNRAIFATHEVKIDPDDLDDIKDSNEFKNMDNEIFSRMMRRAKNDATKALERCNTKHARSGLWCAITLRDQYGTQGVTTTQQLMTLLLKFLTLDGATYTKAGSLKEEMKTLISDINVFLEREKLTHECLVNVTFWMLGEAKIKNLRGAHNAKAIIDAAITASETRREKMTVEELQKCNAGQELGAVLQTIDQKVGGEKIRQLANSEVAGAAVSNGGREQIEQQAPPGAEWRHAAGRQRGDMTSQTPPTPPGDEEPVKKRCAICGERPTSENAHRARDCPHKSKGNKCWSCGKWHRKNTLDEQRAAAYNCCRKNEQTNSAADLEEERRLKRRLVDKFGYSFE